MNKLWLVKREVLAPSLKAAIKGKGRVYEVTEAAKEYQPEEKLKKIGISEHGPKKSKKNK